MPSIDALVLRRAGLLTLAVGLVVTLVGGIVDGSEGIVSGALGTAIVIVFFTVGQLVVGATLRNNPQMAMTVALTTYLVKIGVLFILLIALRDADWLNPKVFASAVVGCTLAWTIAEVWTYARTKVLYVEPERSP